MTNKERWDSYTSGLASPQNYLDWGFLYMTSAALQRRIWLPPDHERMYANLYPILVGKAGIGKGKAIRAITSILQMHALDEAKKQTSEIPGFNAVAEATATLDLKEAKDRHNDGKNSKEILEKVPLIEMAADSVTFEKLVQSMAKAVRRCNHTFLNPVTNKVEPKIYSHSSLCFLLEELESLLRKKNTDNLITFLIQAYDCGDVYRYETKHQGSDRVRNLCLNFMAGTTPAFMQDAFDDSLLTHGFSSRCHFIYAAKNRKSVAFIPELTKEQKQAKIDLGEHIKNLYNLYGQVHISDEVMQKFRLWWTEFESNPRHRVNKSPVLDAYYARKNIHTMKVAMAHHFSESLDMTMVWEDFEWAIEFGNNEEKTMHLALNVETKNPLADPSRKIINYLRMNGDRTFNELLAQFWGDIDGDQLLKILEYLKEMDELTTEQKEHPVNKTPLRYYGAKNQV